MEIGGFFDFELRNPSDIKENKKIAFNSARSALRYIVRELHPTLIYVPYYTCSAVTEALAKEDISIRMYHIDKNLQPIDIPSELSDGEYIIYNNYWGVNSKNIDILFQVYQNKLIVDAAQAFFYENPNVLSFNSCRKFFGVADGAYLSGLEEKIQLMDTQKVSDIAMHLFRRSEDGANQAYQFYKDAERVISEFDIRRMSQLTNIVLSMVNMEEIKNTRKTNFEILHQSLAETNLLALDFIKSPNDIPLVYPYLVEDEDLRNRLIKNQIYVATYWPNVMNWCEENSIEYQFSKYCVPLPVDQRYNSLHMNKIISLVLKK